MTARANGGGGSVDLSGYATLTALNAEAATRAAADLGHLVPPSADATGATDKAAINAALVTYPEVWLQGTYKINGAIIIPSNRTLILADASVTLTNGANDNLIRNTDYTGGSGGNTKIRILGIGKALFDGNNANQTSGETSASHGIVLSHVTNYELGNFQIQATTRYGISPQHTSDGYIHDIWASILSTSEQAICQCLGDSQNILIERIRGVSEDDCIAFSSGEASQYSGLYADGNANGNVSDCVIRDIEVSHTTGNSVNAVRLFCGGGNTIKRVLIEDVRERFPSDSGQQITLGADTFVTTPPAPGDLSDITIRNTNARFLFQTPCSNITIDGVTVPAAVSATRGSPFTFEGAAAGRTINDVSINNVVYNGPGQATPLINFKDMSGQVTVNRLKLGSGLKLGGAVDKLFGLTGSNIILRDIVAPDINAPALSAIPPVGARYAANVGRSNVFAGGDQAISTPSSGFVVPTPDGTKAYRLRVDNAGAVALDRVPYFAKLMMSLGPAGYWRLNESSGTVAADQMGNSGVYIASPTLGAATLLNANGDDSSTSATFNGSTQYVAIPDSPQLGITNALSILAIVKPTAIGAFQPIFAKGASGPGDYAFSLNSAGHLNFTWANDTNFLTDTGTLSAGVTVFVAMTWDGANVRFFIAGAIQSTQGKSNALGVTTGSAARIGSRPSNTLFFGGSMQEVAVFNYRIPDATITQLHNIAGV